MRGKIDYLKVISIDGKLKVFSLLCAKDKKKNNIYMYFLRTMKTSNEHQKENSVKHKEEIMS